MRADGKAIIIITHKLHEVLAAVRPGRGAAEGPVHRHRRDEETPRRRALTDMMVGHARDAEH